MKKVNVKNNIKLKGIKNFSGKDKLIDYFIILPGNEEVYAFSKTFTQNTYDMCKSGIGINELRRKRSKDTGIMKLVKYTNFLMPYLAEYYDLPLAQ